MHLIISVSFKRANIGTGGMEVVKDNIKAPGTKRKVFTDRSVYIPIAVSPPDLEMANCIFKSPQSGR